MHRDRFLQIQKHLHFNLHFITSRIIANTQRYWHPSTAVAVNELLFLFKGRYRHKQHIRGKPHATGLKWYSLCDKSGVFYSFWLYQGEKRSTTSIVTDFAKQLPSDTQHVVFADSYFGSLELARELLRQGRHCVLSCKQTRPSFLFKDWLGKDLRKGEFVGASSKEERLLAVTFNDKRKCNFLTSLHNNSSETIKSKKDDSKKTIPTVARDYTYNMNCVDRGDAFVNNHFYHHRHKKWNLAALHVLIKLALVNAWILFNNLRGKTTEQRQFLIAVCCQLSHEVPSVQTSISTKEHLIIQNPGNNRMKCNYCSTSDDRRRTIYSCNTCKVGLHPDCFAAYHQC